MSRKQSSIMRFLFGPWSNRSQANESAVKSSRRLPAILPATGMPMSLEAALARSVSTVIPVPQPSHHEPHYVLTYFLTKAGARADFVQFLRYLEIEPPPGLIDALYLNAQNDPDLVVGFGEWDSIADFRAFQDSPEFSDIDEEIAPLLEEPAIRYVFRSVGDLRRLAQSAGVHELTVRQAGEIGPATRHYSELERELSREPNLVAIRTGEGTDGNGLILDLIEWTSLDTDDVSSEADSPIVDWRTRDAQRFLHLAA